VRASSIFILMMVLNGFCFFGIQAIDAINPSAGGLLPATTQTLPFDYFFNVDGPTGAGDIYLVNGTPVNTTAVDANWNVEGDTSIGIASVSGIVNLASGMISFLNLLISFITSPFTLLFITGLINYQITYIFGAAYIMAVLLALWQIWTGRLV